MQYRERPWGELRRGAVAVAVVLAAAPSGASAAGPFNVLEWAEGVTTSRDGYSVWITVPSTAHEAVLPPHVEPVGPPGHTMSLGLRCRAPGSPTVQAYGRTYGAPYAQAEIFLENHPDWPGAYTVFHPLHWILELAGRHVERFAVRVTMGDAAAFSSQLERPRTNYSAPRPGLRIKVPVAVLTDLLRAGRPVAVTARGEGVRIDGRFDPATNPQAAAKLASRYCAMPLGDGDDGSAADERGRGPEPPASPDPPRRSREPPAARQLSPAGPPNHGDPGLTARAPGNASGGFAGRPRSH